VPAIVAQPGAIDRARRAFGRAFFLTLALFAAASLEVLHLFAHLLDEHL